MDCRRLKLGGKDLVTAAERPAAVYQRLLVDLHMSRRCIDSHPGSGGVGVGRNRMIGQMLKRLFCLQMPKKTDGACYRAAIEDALGSMGARSGLAFPSQKNFSFEG